MILPISTATFLAVALQGFISAKAKKKKNQNIQTFSIRVHLKYPYVNPIQNQASLNFCMASTHFFHNLAKTQLTINQTILILTLFNIIFQYFQIQVHNLDIQLF